MYQGKDSGVFPIEITIKLDRFDGEEYICAIARDITERKKIHKQLRKYLEHLQELVDSRTRQLPEAKVASFALRVLQIPGCTYPELPWIQDTPESARAVAMSARSVRPARKKCKADQV